MSLSDTYCVYCPVSLPIVCVLLSLFIPEQRLICPRPLEYICVHRSIVPTSSCSFSLLLFGKNRQPLYAARSYGPHHWIIDFTESSSVPLRERRKDHLLRILVNFKEMNFFEYCLSLRMEMIRSSDFLVYFAQCLLQDSQD